MKLDINTYKLSDTGNFGRNSLIIGTAGIIISVIGYFVDSTQFFYSYLTSFVFWITISLGGLFFVLLHHLANAKWSNPSRRLTENVMIILPVMAIFFIPIIFGIKELYHWSHEDIVAADHLLQKKTPYLNVTFFLVRTAGYFLVWFIFSTVLYKTSIRQDSEYTESRVRRFKKLSPPGMILFALTATFASFDWLMSLDAHWYSTIFGVYIFSGSFLAILSFIILIALYLRSNGILLNVITTKHFNDLGRLLFTFVIFWAYITFSQYFLIWYANIPEETVWFIHRWNGSWKYISMIIIFGHFIIPFFVLITAAAKKNLKILAGTSIWLLVMHWIDIYWIVMPNFHEVCVRISWMDFSTMVGIGGFFVWFFWRRLLSHSLIPVNDPSIKESLNESHK
ncbi:hypothetical protein ACFL4T_09160 [candidate division KSB1 bacterium]